MDELVLESSWTGISSTYLTIEVEGLNIQGCKFKGEILFEAESADPVFTRVPRVCLAWLPKSAIDESRQVVSLPLYESHSREKLISYLLVPVKDKSTSHTWTLSGAAFFLE